MDAALAARGRVTDEERSILGRKWVHPGSFVKSVKRRELSGGNVPVYLYRGMTIDQDCWIGSGEILRLAGLAQDGYPDRIADLEEYTELWRSLGNRDPAMRLRNLAGGVVPYSRT